MELLSGVHDHGPAGGDGAALCRLRGEDVREPANRTFTRSPILPFENVDDKNRLKLSEVDLIRKQNAFRGTWGR